MKEGVSWVRWEESSPGGGHSGSKDPVVAGRQAQLELRKVGWGLGRGWA